MKQILILVFISSFMGLGILALSFPARCDAAGLIPCGGAGQPPCNFCHIFALVSNIVTFLLVPSLSLNGGFAAVPLIAAALLALGGFFIFASAGNMARLEQGKKIIFATIVGILIIYGSWLFVSTLLTSLGVSTWTGLDNWWKIQCELAAGPGAPGPVTSGCLDGMTEQDFGTTSAGKKVHGCNGSVAYIDAESLCAAGWHVGDVKSDAGLSTLLSNNAGANLMDGSVRWVRMSGDPGNVTGYPPLALEPPYDRCWGSPLHASCTVVSSFVGHPGHGNKSGGISFAGSKTYLNGILVTTSYVANAGDPSPLGSDDRGTICMEGPPPPPPVGIDNDGDGHNSIATGGTDCDDNCPTCFPGSPTFTTTPDSRDQNCNGTIDENTALISPSSCTKPWNYGGFTNARPASPGWPLSTCDSYCGVAGSGVISCTIFSAGCRADGNMGGEINFAGCTDPSSPPHFSSNVCDICEAGATMTCSCIEYR